MVRVSLVAVVSGLGLACTSAEPPPALVIESVEARPAHAYPEPEELAEPEPPPQCPAGTERRERGGEGPSSTDWWCARGETPHGPFLQQSFDPRRHTWYEIRGEHVDGERHGLVESEGFYDVEHSGRSRVFLREQLDRGRVVRSNEASVRVDLAAAAPVATRRFVVRASGLSRTAEWHDEPTAIGSFDVEVAATWVDAPADAPPSVLRVELSAPGTPAPVRADGLLHPFDDPEPPGTATDLPLGHVPTASATWRACDPAGCELELLVTLRWHPPGPGRVEAHVTARAVPDSWPAAAPIELTMIDEAAGTP